MIRRLENLSIAALLLGLFGGGALGAVTPAEGDPYAWVLAAVVAGPFVVAASVFTATAIALRASAQ